MTLLDRLAERKLLVVTGKGGVGKSTISATLGRILSAHGRRVLVLEVDPRESLYRMLGVSPSGGECVRVSDRLWVQNLRPMQVLSEFVEAHLRVGFLVRRVLGSPVYQHFAEGAPGLKELAVLGHAYRTVTHDAPGPRIDLVVLDAPATGHGVSLLAAPSLVARAIQDGPFGQLSGQLAGFIADPELCGILVATVAEEMPVQEAIELLESLDERLSRRPEMILVNELYPKAERAHRDDPDPSLRLWLERLEVNERELERLARRWKGPRIDLPLVPLGSGPGLLDELRSHLQAALERIEAQQ